MILRSAVGIRNGGSRVVRIFVSLALITLLLFVIGRDGFADYASRIPASYLFFILVLFTLQFLLVVWRWRMVLLSGDARAGYWQLVEVQGISTVANAFLVNGIGGLAVRLALVKRMGVDLSVAVGATLVERAITVVVLAVMSVGGLPLIAVHIGPRWVATAGFVMTVVVAIGSLFFLLGDLPALRALRTRFGQIVQPTFAAMGKMLRHPSRVIAIVGVAILAQAVYFGASYGAILATGANIEWLAFLGVMPAVALIASLPISVGGWGTREGAMVAGLSLIGVDAGAALVASVIIGLLTMIAAVPACMLSVVARRGKWSARTYLASQTETPTAR